MNYLEIKVVAPKIVANFDEFKNGLEVYTKKFEIEVTSENIKEAKESGANLNKLKANIKSEAKKYLLQVEAPIKEFKMKLKEIENLLDAKRLKIVDGISFFEDAKRLEHSQKMKDYINEKLAEVELRHEFRNFMLPAASVSGLTSKGDLTKKFKDEIDDLIKNAIEKQRLADIEIENKRLRDEARANEILRQREERDRQIKKDELLNTETSHKPISDTAKAYTDEKQHNVVENTNNKSTYEIILKYRVTATRGVSCDDMLKKVVPMIEKKQIPIFSSNCLEISYE